MTQCDIILGVLRTWKNRWVPMPSLANAANCYAVNSRVADLRKRGYDVENKTEYVDGVKRSYYRLNENGEDK